MLQEIYKKLGWIFRDAGAFSHCIFVFKTGAAFLYTARCCALFAPVFML